MVLLVSRANSGLVGLMGSCRRAVCAPDSYFVLPVGCVSFTSTYLSSLSLCLLENIPPDSPPQGPSWPYITLLGFSHLFLSRRHQSDGNEMAHTRLRASTRDLRASPKPASKSTIEEDLKKLIDLESPTPESQKNFKV